MSGGGKRISTLALVALMTIALVACSTRPAATPRPTAIPGTSAPSHSVAPSATLPAGRVPDAGLLVGKKGDPSFIGIAAFDGQRLLDSLPAGAPDADWGSMITAVVQGDETLIADRGVESSETSPVLHLPGAWALPTIGADPVPVGVSLDRQVIVLVEADHSATPAKSSFVVVSGSLTGTPAVIDLAGDFKYDALSPTGSILYVVEQLTPGPGGRYQVRAVNLPAGTLRPEVVADKNPEPDEDMAGYPLSQLRAPAGMVFTLYNGREHPFIHALSSVDAFALCIDLPALPAGLNEGDPDWGIAASPDWTSVYAVNATTGDVVEISVPDLAIKRTVKVEPLARAPFILAKFGGEPTGPAARRVIVSSDGATLYAAGAEGILALSTKDLAVTGRYLAGEVVDALALTRGGEVLFVVTHAGGNILALDPATGAELGQVPGSGYDRILGAYFWGNRG